VFQFFVFCIAVATSADELKYPAAIKILAIIRKDSCTCLRFYDPLYKQPRGHTWHHRRETTLRGKVKVKV